MYSGKFNHSFVKNSGPILALISSLLFGISPVLTKFIVGDIQPVLLAGLLYLGSALILLIPCLLNYAASIAELRKTPRSHRIKLIGATISGGILAPIALVFGIQNASAFEVSLLLNLESVATTIIAWLIFKEHVGGAVWIGKLFLIIGGIIITVSPSVTMINGGVANASASANISWASILVITACIFWGIDNNLTRDIDELSPNLLAMLKGLVAGVFNIFLAFALSFSGLIAPLSEVKLLPIAISLLIGVFSYGISLVFFVKALRHIGASRTSTYFATGPFIGMFAAVIFLGERPALIQWGASILMVLGLWILYRELHDHLHKHHEIVHSHEHSHGGLGGELNGGGPEVDEHHQHQHEQGSEQEESTNEYVHAHPHRHSEMIHSHPHYPDIHHRHKH